IRLLGRHPRAGMDEPDPGPGGIRHDEPRLRGYHGRIRRTHLRAVQAASHLSGDRVLGSSAAASGWCMTRPDARTSSSDPRRAEFDSYAAGYDAGMGNPLKRLFGDSADQYIAVKTRWLNNDLRSFRQDPAILDFGCGEGALLRQLAVTRNSASLHGCDVSEAMVQEARKR